MPTSVKKIRDGLYLISWGASATPEQTVKVKLEECDDNCDTTLRLRFSGNGTHFVILELSNLLPNSKEKNYTSENLPVVFATKGGQCQVMTPKKKKQKACGCGALLGTVHRELTVPLAFI